MSSLQHILRLHNAVEAAKHGGVPGEEEMCELQTNRGNKLVPGARFVSSRTLNVPDRLYPIEVQNEAGVVTKETAEEGAEGDADEEADMEVDEEAEEEELKESLGVDAQAILKPISAPSDVCTHEPTRAIFTNRFPAVISKELLTTIIDEKKTLAKVSNLFMSLLGDDDMLMMPAVVEQADKHPRPQNAKQSAAWFFQPIVPQTDKNLGLESAEADELRQKLLVTQQLLTEYVRSLEQVRDGLQKSQRLRTDVLNWCRELNHEDYIKIGLDSQNNSDNAGLGERPAKDFV